MRHKLLTQRTLYVWQERYAESAFRDACRTSADESTKVRGPGVEARVRVYACKATWDIFCMVLITFQCIP